LTELAEVEPAAEVRRRLYEALLPQSGIPADRLARLVREEGDLATRIAGLNALASAFPRKIDPSVVTWFDGWAVPELYEVATTPNSLNLQMRAVFALRRARTTAATAALEGIARNAVPQVATAARNGLPPPGI
jgi:hypothetical protein